MNEEIDARLPLWRALSELFLDSEPTDVTYTYIVRTIRESGYSLDEAESILWLEVFPVLESNLRSLFGVWDGWSDDWLLEHLAPAPSDVPLVKKGSKASVTEIERCWRHIVTRHCDIE
ncbi:MAG: hypothetical protein LAT63_02470 [Marinobacter sp.]|nr:hypothetical protein [Marinobacter sp.]